jgi:hypothetical protein
MLPSEGTTMAGGLRFELSYLAWVSGSERRVMA